MKLRVGIDVGGTFTDVTAYDEDAGKLVAIRKYLSDPAQPAAVMETVATDLARDFGKESVSLLLHGSTVALNTLLEGKGARVGLLTTRGFRDIYEIGRQWRGEDVFNLFAPGPKMLLTRERIFEIRERLDASGEVIEPLEADDVASAMRKLLAIGVEALAVCFLFAYANPRHELAAAEIIRALAPDLHVSLSHEVNPEWREYERTAATVANAYIAPPVSRHLYGLEQLTLRHLPAARTLMMKSDGGVSSVRMLARTPVKAVMSGPVAGVIAARDLGDVKGIEKLISYDAGGTSSDMAVLPGAPLYKSEITVARHPLRTHAIDIATIGAGGGSIASVELGGVLKVGPDSAGAHPGPACYGRGGNEPTLTDALVLLGHLNPSALLDGAMPIESEKARAAVRSRVSQPLCMPEIEAAFGILRVLATNVMVAMRTITVERGYDPREFSLVPFGGMGPAIAGLIAAETGIGRVLIPRDPGIFSAHGLLVSDARHKRSLTRVTAMDKVSAGELEAVFAELETKALQDLAGEGFASERLITRRQAGMRYRGQSYEVTVELGSLAQSQHIEDLIARFHAAHHRRYGHMAQAEAVEIVNFQATAIGMTPRPRLQKFAGVTDAQASPQAKRQAYFSGTEGCEVPVWWREDLVSGLRLEGPAIIEEKTSTIVLYPGQRAEVDEYLNIEIAVPGSPD
jgi:N-methylhydantoinase A